MSNVERFEELLRADEALQEKMRAATDAFRGDRADEAAVFEAVVAPLAAEAGLPFTLAEARARALDGAVVSDDALDAVAGGGENYYNQPDDSCIGIGFGFGADACTKEHGGAGACAGLGIGFFGF